jgi:major membrane immunogen (membrane-anchored lipoprotein)
MATFRSKVFAVVATLFAAALLAGCANSGTPQDGRYQTHGTGWDNFRA